MPVRQIRKGRIVTDIDDKRRREIEELLPFLLNGTLEGAELAKVEAAVAADPKLAQELEFLRAVRGDVKTRPTAQSPGEFGLARLMKDVDSERTTIKPTGVSRIWQYAAVAAVTLIIAQSALLVTAPDKLLQLAGGSIETYSGPVLTVAFEADATEGEIRKLLTDFGLEIVGGPSALGLYQVSVYSEDATDAALIYLNTAAGIIESAQRE